MESKLETERVLLAAQGYAELGMVDDAMAELDSLPSSAREDSGVLQVRLAVHMHARHWEKALEISRVLCGAHPDETAGYIHAAFCLHELGRTADAKAFLLAGPAALLDEATYHYNLGCYDATLGNIEDAQAHLRASFRLDRNFREFAKKDPDLRSVWNLL